MRGKRLTILLSAVGGVLLLAVVAWGLLTPQTPIREWRDCINRQHINQSDPWAYQGGGEGESPPPLPFEYNKHHTVLFVGEDVPVPAGTVVWTYPEQAVLWNYFELQEHHKSRLRLSVEGRDAALFDVTYHADGETIAYLWRGTGGGRLTNHHAVWYKPDRWKDEQRPVKFSGNIVTAARDLPEGEYEIELRVEVLGEYYVDCGQGEREPRQLRVIVDRDRPTVPPATVGVAVSERDDGDGWAVSWDVDADIAYYLVDVYRPNGDGDEMLGGSSPYYVMVRAAPFGSPFHLTLRDIEGNCGNVLAVRIWSYGKGWGTTYLADLSDPSESVQFQTPTCPVAP